MKNRSSCINVCSLLIGISLLLILASGCSQQETETDKIRVVVSIVPLIEFVEKIGGEKVDISTMVPPGASPHTYEPTPSQLVEVSKADIYVKVGTPIEFELAWFDKILGANNDMLVVDASFGIKPAEIEDKRAHDPHIWLSPKNAKIMVENICKGLVLIDSTNKEYYTAKKEAFLAELESLDNDIEEMLSGKTERKFMIYHPAWGGFARDYNLEQIAVEVEGKKPTAKSIQKLIEQAKKHRIRVIFASPQFDTESAEVIAKEIGGKVVLINPLEKDYVTNMRKVTQALSEAME